MRQWIFLAAVVLMKFKMLLISSPDKPLQGQSHSMEEIRCANEHFKTIHDIAICSGECCDAASLLGQYLRWQEHRN